MSARGNCAPDVFAKGSELIHGCSWSAARAREKRLQGTESRCDRVVEEQEPCLEGESKRTDGMQLTTTGGEVAAPSHAETFLKATILDSLDPLAPKPAPATNRVP